MMKNELVTREVNFYGDAIMCAQDNSTGKIYVGITWVCDGIGLSEGQTKNEKSKMKKDLVLLQGGRNLILPTNGGYQEISCLELDFLPLWLAKISITPKMQEESPELVKKLMHYQLKAKDVLAQAFIKPKEVDIDNFKIPTTLSEALLLSANLAKENEIMKPKAEQFDLYIDNDGTSSLNQAAKKLKTKRNKMMQFLRDMNVFNQDNSPASYYSNQDYFEVKSYTYVVKGGRKYQIAITRVTAKGQDFLYRYLTKYIDEYYKYDSDFKNKISEVTA
jgi:phage antirepressor YoqD-like protein